MSREIKFQLFDPMQFRDAIETFHTNDLERRRAERWNPPDVMSVHAPYRVERDVHPIHTFRLATQDILVAFDEKNMTLHIGEPRRDGRGGYVEQTAQRAAMEGRINPFYCEVSDAARARDHAEEARNKHAKVVKDAIARLKSDKPGIRRRAKRLLERLGR